MSERPRWFNPRALADGLQQSLGLDDEIENLREQFYVTLRAYMARIEARNPPTSPALERVRLLLAPGRRPRWSECYEVEQLLVSLFDDVTLRTELEVRLLEAKGSLRPALYAFYDQAANPAKELPQPDAERRRSVLARLVNDLQWRYTMQEGKRRFAKSLTLRTGAAFLISLIVFAGLIGFVYMKGWRFSPGDLRLLGAAGVAGAWGATFSMLTGVAARTEKKPIYELNVMRSLTMLSARTLVGAGAACVLYLFFSSGFLKGAAFPDLARSGVCSAQSSADCLTPPTLALLLIWCFIAGFSEKLVPGLLAKAENKIDPPSADASATSQHYRPSEPGVASPSSGVRAAGTGETKSA